MNIRRGRPTKGTPPARDRILRAAEELFLASGYEATTVRRIAQEAHCDPALVAYHFGSKHGLFEEVTTGGLGPAGLLSTALAGPPEQLGFRIVARVVSAWDDPIAGPHLRGLMRMALVEEDATSVVHEYLDRELLGPLVEYFDGRDARSRATAVLAVVAGLIAGRYLLRLEPLASARQQDVIRSYGRIAQLAAHPELLGGKT